MVTGRAVLKRRGAGVVTDGLGQEGFSLTYQLEGLWEMM